MDNKTSKKHRNTARRNFDHRLQGAGTQRGARFIVKKGKRYLKGIQRTKFDQEMPTRLDRLDDLVACASIIQALGMKQSETNS